MSTPSLKDRLFERQHGLCWICLKPMNRILNDPYCATVDHIQPLGSSGCNKPRNKLLAHQICNNARGRAVLKERVRTIVSRAFSRIHEATKRRALNP